MTESGQLFSLIFPFYLRRNDLSRVFDFGVEIARQVVVVEVYAVGFFADVNTYALCCRFVVANAVICEDEVVGFAQDAYAIAFVFVAVVEDLIVLKGVAMPAHGFGFVAEEYAFTAVAQ